MTTTVEAKTLPLREITEDGELILRFHEGQKLARDSKARFTLILAGTQSGKTSYGPHWLHDRMREVLETLQPGEALGDFLVVTSNFELFKMRLLPEMKEVFENILEIGHYWSQSKVLELREGLVPEGKLWASKADDLMWGRVILRSAESLAGLESSTARAAWLDELGMDEFSLEAWEAIIRRLSIYRGRVLGTSTLYNSGWLKEEVYDKWEAGDTDYDIIQFDSTMNPAFPQAEFDRVEAIMDPAKFDMMYRGRYTQAAGLVYKKFDTQACVIPRFEIPDNWLWYTGHDFGGKNPATMVFAQDPATSLIYVVDEYAPDDTTVHDQVKYLQELLKDRRVIKRLGGSHTEDGWRGNYTGEGWPITEPASDVRAVDVGIANVLALHAWGRIIAFSDLKGYLAEKGSYSYKMVGKRVTDEIRNKSAYHFMDAERYALGGFRDAGQAQAAPVTVTKNRWGAPRQPTTLRDLLRQRPSAVGE